ncbi:hypothetical protein BOTCAL_0070g00250 [Botryotinia calthae]|uniref:Uncharacterized protein n=1 Tax=Botryotinia calthae TaxID=38488 RepID=A0A4Y8DBJ1_9HELO|nr:hypothetical protein BOTCAL_0070g00250 [Botryotinia calthae]
MNNPQTFNIINPDRGSHQIYYEKVDSCSIWRKCLQYRPRVKGLKVLNPCREEILQMPRFLRKLRCRNPRGVRSKQASSFSDTRKSSQDPITSVKGARISSAGDQLLAPNPLLPIQLTPKILDPAPLKACVETSKRETILAEPATGKVLSPECNANYGPHQPYTPYTPSNPNPNHEIGMALTTSQTILNYSSSQQAIRNDNVQKISDREDHGSIRSNGRSSWGILQIGEEAKGTELVDISTLVSPYPQPKRKLVAHKISADEVEHHPLPQSASTKNLVQLLEIEASRQEQEKEEMEKTTHHTVNSREPRTSRDSRRCGQVWNSEETRKSFLAIEALDTLALGLRLT